MPWLEALEVDTLAYGHAIVVCISWLWSDASSLQLCTFFFIYVKHSGQSLNKVYRRCLFPE